MLRFLLAGLVLCLPLAAAAQTNEYAECKSACFDAAKPCRKKCPFLGGTECKTQCNAEITICQEGCRSQPGVCSVYSLTDPYHPDALVYALAQSATAITDEVVHKYLDLLRDPNQVDEFKTQRWLQEQMPRARTHLSETRDCIQRRSPVRLFRFLELPRYTFDGGYFDFTALRDKPLRIYNHCGLRQTVAVRLQGSDEALRFHMSERDAQYLVQLTRKEEQTDGVQIGVSINGGGPSIPGFSDHGVMDPHPKPQPRLGEANIGFLGHITVPAETREVKADDSLAPVCSKGMTGSAADAALPQSNGGVAGKTTVLTLTVEEIRIEDRRYGTAGQRKESGAR